MKGFIHIVFILSLFSASVPVKSQNITGSWEGEFNGEYLQVNIEQQNNELCGYTYDRELDNDLSFCMARFSGRYDDDKQIYFIAGNSFIRNSGGHVLMRIILWKSRQDEGNTLRGKVYVQNTIMSILGMGGDDVILKKVSGKPKSLPGNPVNCFPKPKRDNAPVPQKGKPPARKVTRENNDSIKQLPGTVIKQDSIVPAREKAVITERKEKTFPEKAMAARKQSRQGRIKINVDEINLKVYDNGTVDNDTVSIFYNGRLLLSHQRLSEKAIELKIKLDKGITEHEITLFAESLGSIPPNTALVVVTAGKNRYELRSKASMEENAVLVFEYAPD